MKLLVTGAFKITPEETEKLKSSDMKYISCPMSASRCRRISLHTAR